MLSKLTPIFLSLLLGSSSACENSAKLSLTIQYDNTPEQTSVEIREFTTGSQTTTEITLDRGENKLEENIENCIPKDQLTQITLKDSEGDGFFGNGYATISINDRLIATVSDFGAEVSYFVFPHEYGCPSGAAENPELPFVFDIKHDGSPGQTIWSLVSDGDILVSNTDVGNANILANQFLTVSKCIPEVSDNVFEITDTNGIASPGFYRLFATYNLIAVGGGDDGFTGSETTPFKLDFTDRSPPVETATLAPSMAPSRSGCSDDFEAKFSAADGKEHPCIYLSDVNRRETAIPQFCFNSAETLKDDTNQTHYLTVQRHCPYTCDTCLDKSASCVDDEDAKFMIDNKGGRDCRWVRVRLTSNYVKKFDQLCGAGKNGSIHCKQSCLSCDSE